jgi:hypothetical protein
MTSTAIHLSGSPFLWGAERRFLLRCELDAAYFHLYGLNHEDTSSKMPVMKPSKPSMKEVEPPFRVVLQRKLHEFYTPLAPGS